MTPDEEIVLWEQGQSSSMRILVQLLALGLMASSLLANDQSSNHLFLGGLMVSLAGYGWIGIDRLREYRRANAPGPTLASWPESRGQTADELRSRLVALRESGPDGQRVAAFLVALLALPAEMWAIIRQRAEQQAAKNLRVVLENRFKIERARSRRVVMEGGSFVELAGNVAATLEAAARGGFIPFRPPYRDYKAVQAAVNALLLDSSLYTHTKAEIWYPFTGIPTLEYPKG